MAKGYWIAKVDVDDPEAYKPYQAQVGVVMRKFGGRFVVRGGRAEVMEGTARARVVVIEFRDVATAHEAYRSPEYEKARGMREPISTADLLIAEGYDGPQPADG